MQLYSDKCPKTCKNFLELCCGGRMEYEKDTPLELTYKKSIFHRIVPNGWIQGGGIYSSLFASTCEIILIDVCNNNPSEIA